MVLCESFLLQTISPLICCIFFQVAGFCYIPQASLEHDLPVPASGVLELQACDIMLMDSNGHMMISTCMSDFSVDVIKVP